MRGIKRVCQACAARFYDLSRDPIVCPSCGAHYEPEAQVLVATIGTSTSGSTDKTGWRGRRFKHPEPEPARDPEIPPGGAAAESAPEEAPAPIDDIVLDEEPDEADISGLLDHHAAEPRER
jgi:uncharacterized protein (TIGR02300 family)